MCGAVGPQHLVRRVLLGTDFGLGLRVPHYQEEPLTQEVLLAMQNHVGLTRKYTSAYLTALDWCKRRQPVKSATPAPATSPAYDPAALFGYAQSADAGLAQARNSPEYQAYLAKQATLASEQDAALLPDLQAAA